MKKIAFLLIAVGLILVGCNPLEDIYDDIDSQANPVVGTAEYTLTDDDYADLDLGFGSFNSEDQAKDSIPQLLAEMYPLWGESSSVLVNYNLFRGNAEGLGDYTGADVYTLTNADYASTGSDAFGFYPDVDPEEGISTVLENTIESPVEGQIVLAEYKQYIETPEIGLATIFSYDFSLGFNNWTVNEESGDEDVWTEEMGFVQGNGFFGGQIANAEWLVSPEIDLTAEEGVKFQISQAIRFAGDLGLVKILVSTEWDGTTLDIDQWDEITLEIAPEGNSDTMVLSEDYDFSAYDGETINIAFRYESTDDDAARWRIESLVLKTVGIEGDTDSKGSYFTYNDGEWEASEGVYYLSVSDYDSMGEASGQPGAFNNFSSSVSADDYLPTFLDIKYPFAQEEDELFVIYKYFSSNSGLGTRGNLYTVIDGEWSGYNSTIETSLQFGFESGVWVPDNTIRYTLVSSDYEAVVAALADVEGFVDVVSNLDSFGNFNRTDGNWTDEQIITALDVVLDNLDPNAEDGQKYVLTIATWAPGNSTEEWAMIKNEGEWVTQASLEE